MSKTVDAKKRLALKAKRKKTVRAVEKVNIGWREWVRFPDFGDFRVKAKIDTGARTSAIHAWRVAVEQHNGVDIVSFELHPNQDDNKNAFQCKAPLIDRRIVKNSGGGTEERFVVSTTIALGGESFPIELTLTRRDEMGFRMLLGRTALRRRFLVDPGRSFLLGT